MKRHRSTFVLALAVFACGSYIYFDRNATTSEELDARRRSVFKTFHRERITRIEVTHPSGRYELERRGSDWFVLRNNVARKADVMEVEHALGEIEGAEATRTPGVLDGTTRARFGLDRPRASVVIHEGATTSARFDLGGAVQGEAACYVATEGRVVVLPKSFADAFDRASTDLRDKAIADLDVSRIEALELEAAGERRVLQRSGIVWRLSEPAQGRAARGAVEAITTELRELRAARVLEDDVNEAGMARYGINTPSVRLTVRRGSVEPVVLRIGNDCAGHEGEIAATRDGTGTVVCLARSFVDALRVTTEALRDDHLVASRTDEVSQVRVRGPGQDLIVRRDSEHWVEGPATAAGRDGGASGNVVDGESVEAWLNTLHDLSAAARLPDDSRAAHGLLPSLTSIEIARTGVDGVETIHVGSSEETGFFVSRDDEPIVLQLAPSVAETLRVEPIRFHARGMIHDVDNELAALQIEAGSYHEDLQRLDGQWRVVRPLAVPADGGMLVEVARQLAGLEVDRWVASAPRPEHGFATPRARITARFEGRGPVSDAGASDASTAAVRSYTLVLGGQALGGGIFAMLEGRPGVGVLPRSVLDGLVAPHLDRSIVHIASDDVSRMAIVQGVTRVEVLRDGARWRSVSGAPVEEQRMNEVLERLANLIAPRVHSYGPPPPAAGLGTMTLEVTRLADAGPPLVYTFGEPARSVEEGTTYVRRSDLDATMVVPNEFVETLRAFRP